MLRLPCQDDVFVLMIYCKNRQAKKTGISFRLSAIFNLKSEDEAARKVVREKIPLTFDPF